MKERLQKIISGAGIASRRKAEEMILSGLVLVNGEKAVIGQQADIDLDEIIVDGIRIKDNISSKIYIMLNKPKGYISTLSDDKGRKTVIELLSNVCERVYPVGRLDMDSEGLLLFTNDGDFANSLMHPSKMISKVYEVVVQGRNISESIKKLREMRELEGETIAPAEVSLLERKGDEADLLITIHEGKNRQIRRMCAASGLAVLKLVRIKEGNLELSSLPSGKWRYLTKKEIENLREEL